MAYKITIKSTVDGETNEIVAFGNVFKEYGSTAIDFSDEENGNYTKIVIGEDMVSIIKEGDISTVLLFERGKSTFSELSTEYGEIPVETRTTDISEILTDDSVMLKLAYTSFVGGLTERFDVNVTAEKI